MKPILNTVSQWFGVFMVILVFVLAGMVAFTDFMNERLFGPKRIFFIVLMLVYGLYRSYRIYHWFKYKRHEV